MALLLDSLSLLTVFEARASLLMMLKGLAGFDRAILEF